MNSQKWYLPIILSFLLAGCSGSGSMFCKAAAKVTLTEFETTYAKADGGMGMRSKSTIDDREKYLDLYKIPPEKIERASRALGFDRDSSLVNE